jgi:tetratricopeptide (TPR) repeat protein
MPRLVSIRADRAVRLVLPLLLAGGLARHATAAPTPPETDRPAAATSAAATGDERGAKRRALAEKEYARGYEDAEAGRKLLEEGEREDAATRFAAALERFEEAVRLDETYADGWNMVGYCARRTGDTDRAFDAYDRALALDPDHEEAHEYLGEAYLSIGNVEKAREQLAWLREKGSDEAEELEEAIEKASSGAQERPEQAEKPEKPEQAEQAEKTEKTEKGEKAEKPERPERPEAPEKP